MLYKSMPHFMIRVHWLLTYDRVINVSSELYISLVSVFHLVVQLMLYFKGICGTRRKPQIQL